MNKIVIAVAVVVVLAVFAGVYLTTGGGASPGSSQASASISSAYYPNATIAASTTAQQNLTSVPKTNSSSSPQQGFTVETSNSATLGTFLANGTGYTLYTYASDSPNSGTSSCYGGCASVWPPFYASTLVLSQGLNASSFGTITRSDGSRQTTYKGLPLYLYAGDSKPGQTNGQGVGGFTVAKT